MSSPIPVPGTGLAVVTDRLWSIRLFYQLLDNHLEQSKHLDGVWTSEHLNFSPVEATPLAAITYGGGREVSKPLTYFRYPALLGYVGRSACTTSTPTTLSKSYATLKAKAGIRERSAS